MKAGENFAAIGDARDIPLALGMIIIAWNSCESKCHQMIRDLASKGRLEYFGAVEPLISELGSVQITQALKCYANELPQDEAELALRMFHLVQSIETSRVYRNYYIHNISAVSLYGIDFSESAVAKDDFLQDNITQGPFANVYSKTAKGKQRFSMDFITIDDLMRFQNYLAEVNDFIKTLNSCIINYLRYEEGQERLPLPPLPATLTPLIKPLFDHLDRTRPRALAPWVSASEKND